MHGAKVSFIFFFSLSFPSRVVRGTYTQTTILRNLPSKKALLILILFGLEYLLALTVDIRTALTVVPFKLMLFFATTSIWQQTMLTLMSAFCASTFTIFTALLPCDLLALCIAALLGCPLK